jgi:hypothetical protein
MRETDVNGPSRPASASIRLFISSTFLDMEQEREVLLRHALPMIRQRVMKGGRSWAEVDLRWGIAQEAGPADVVRICLQEVERCVPYCIALLGERYGWVPPVLPADVLQHRPWLAEFEGCSISELEIRVGIIDPWRRGDRSGRVYCRRTAAAATVSHEHDRLDNLKRAIIDAGVPIREYGSAHELADIVVDDLSPLLDELRPDAARHLRAAQALHHSNYVPRPILEKALTRAVNEERAVLLRGACGSGKSATMAALARTPLTYRRLFKKHEWRVISFFADLNTVSDREVLDGLVRQLGAEPQSERPLSAVFASALRCATRAGRVLMLLDGLYQGPFGTQTPFDWLPDLSDPNLSVVLSWPSGAPAPPGRTWAIVDMTEFDIDAQRSLVSRHFGDYGKGADATIADAIHGNVRAPTPLRLRIILNELRLANSSSKAMALLTEYAQLEGIGDLYERIIRRWNADLSGGDNLVERLLALLLASRNGLRETELLWLLGSDGHPLDGRRWGALFATIRDDISDRAGLLAVTRTELLEAAQRVVGSVRIRAAHHALASYFAEHRDDHRWIDELPFQLVRLSSWEQLETLLADPSFLQQAWQRDPRSVANAWALLETNSHATMTRAYDSTCLRDWPVPSARAAQQALRDAGHLDAAELVARAALARATVGEEALLHHDLGMIAWQRGRTRSARSAFELAHDRANESGNVAASRRALASLCAAERMTDGISASTLERARKSTQNAEESPSRLLLCTELAVAEAEAGQRGRGLDELALAWQEYGDTSLYSYVRSNQARLERLRGKTASARRLLDDAWIAAKRSGEAQRMATVLLERAALHASVADFDSAWAALDEQEQLPGARAGRLYWQRELARVAIALNLGQAQVAHGMAEKICAEARACGADQAQAEAERVLQRTREPR